MEGIISFCPRVIAAVPDESYKLVEMMKRSSALYAKHAAAKEGDSNSSRERSVAPYSQSRVVDAKRVIRRV